MQWTREPQVAARRPEAPAGGAPGRRLRLALRDSDSALKAGAHWAFKGLEAPGPGALPGGGCWAPSWMTQHPGVGEPRTPHGPGCG